MKKLKTFVKTFILILVGLPALLFVILAPVFYLRQFNEMYAIVFLLVGFAGLIATLNAYYE